MSLALLAVGRAHYTTYNRPVRSGWGPPRPIASRRQRNVLKVLLPSSVASASRDAEQGITIPVNYAELLGLSDIQLPLQPAVEKAYDDLINTPLEEGYSELAHLGKEKLLFAARDRLHSVRGRTTLLSPSVQVEPLLLPGAMALLHQLKRYDLVVQLSEEGAGLGARQIRTSSRDTLRDFEQDMALATALAQCGLADSELRGGHPALACARLQEALHLLADAPHAGGSAGGGGLLPRLGGGGAAGGGAPRVLAPRLQADIQAALAQYHPDAVADYLQIPFDRTDFDLRAREVAALREWARGPGSARSGAQPRPALTPDYMARVVPRLTAAELCSLYDWGWLAAGGSSARCAWYYPGLLKRAALAHLVAGFTERNPSLIRTALRLFNALKKQNEDVALCLAMCHLLLGDAAGALSLLQQDEQAQQAQRGSAAQESAGGGRAAGHDGGGGSDGGAWGSGPEARHAVMQFVRDRSPEGVLDLRPGLAAFGGWWLGQVAYPEFQDTALGAAPRPDVAAYFADPRVQAFLAAQDGSARGGLLADARAWLLARLGGPAPQREPSPGGSGPRQPLSVAGLLAGALRLLAAAAMLAAAVLAAARLRGGGAWGAAGALLRPPSASQPALPSAEATAADIGVPPGALRWLPPWERRQAGGQQQAPEESTQQAEQQDAQQAQRQAQQAQQAQQEEQRAQQQAQQAQQAAQARVLDKAAATRLVKAWLPQLSQLPAEPAEHAEPPPPMQSVKAEAMGPRHTVARLSQVLEEPMLSAVASEAAQADASGWHWLIKPHKCRVDSLDASHFSPADGGGHVTALATVSESAQLRGADGEAGESYKTSYQVEYTLVLSGGAWKIASAVVLLAAG